ncbi:MAG: hypothetical protein AB1705_04310 [Verrucomicrobiota bacterium]
MSKAAKKRSCPAVGREISSAECGENRNTRYACPAGCPHNPFAPANYDQLLGIEDEVIAKVLERLAQTAPDRSALERGLTSVHRSDAMLATQTLVVWRFFLQTGPDGLTGAQRWERAGFGRMRNDERALLRAQMRMRVTLFEVRRVLDAERTEAVDLFDPGSAPFIIQDRGLARISVRFGAQIGWVYDMPHFHRLSGVALSIPEIDDLEPAEVVTEIVRHLGGPSDGPGLRRWLAEHMVRFQKALRAVGEERTRLMFANIDGKFGKAVYELKRPFAECRDLLDQHPDVAEDDLSELEANEGFAQARVWFVPPDDTNFAMPAGGRAVLGRVLLGMSHWRLEAFGEERTSALRSAFEQAMGTHVQFVKQRLDNFGASMSEKYPKPDPALLPPRLLENVQQIQLVSSRLPAPLAPKSEEEMHQDLLTSEGRAWLDRAIPGLDGRTPREAACDPALRPRLVRMMKSRVRKCDADNLQTGSSQDVNWMLRELGLNEILFDPPPPREPLSPREELDDEFDNLNNYPDAPPLPPRPFTLEEVRVRLEEAMAKFESADEAIVAMEASGSTLIADLEDIGADLLDDQAMLWLEPFLAQVWYVFVPPGTRGPELDYDALAKAFGRQTQALAGSLQAALASKPGRLLQDGPQPNAQTAILALMLESLREAPAPQQPKAEAQFYMTAMLLAAVDEMDRACRAR